MLNRSRLMKIDHTVQCQAGGSCDCPTIGESIAEASAGLVDAMIGKLPPWLTEADRPALVADARRIYIATLARV